MSIYKQKDNTVRSNCAFLLLIYPTTESNFLHIVGFTSMSFNVKNELGRGVLMNFTTRAASRRQRQRPILNVLRIMPYQRFLFLIGKIPSFCSRTDVVLHELRRLSRAHR